MDAIELLAATIKALKEAKVLKADRVKDAVKQAQENRRIHTVQQPPSR